MMVVDETFSVGQLLQLTAGFHRTSTVKNIQDKSVVFVKTKEWLWRLKEKLEGNTKEVIAFCDAIFWNDVEMDTDFKKRARPLFVWDMMEKFVLFHNEVNRDRPPASNEFAGDCKMHPSVVMAVAGMRYIRSNGKPVAMKHMGNVVVERGVEIGPYSVIHRATMDSTVIGRSTKIGAFVNVGHNVVIGKNCMLTPMVAIAGSCTLGDNVWVGMQTAIADGLKICSDVKIGMGSRVVKDITEPGLYFGSPAERKGDWDGSL